MKNTQNMLIRFAVQNYLSIKTEQVFSMVAAPIKEKFESCNDNVFSSEKAPDLLKSAVIYGANASGKSNFIKSFGFFQNFTILSASFAPNQPINVIPFLLSDATQKEPSSFEVTFFWKNKIYRYGFKLSSNEVIEEWFFIKDLRETAVFYRNGDDIDILAKYKILQELKLKKMIRPNALLLSLAAQFNDETAKDVFGWFANINSISGLSDALYSNFTLNLLENAEKKDIILGLLRVADLGIANLRVNDLEGESIALTIGMNNQTPTISKQKSVIKNLHTVKQVLNEKGELLNYIEFPFEQYESEGTKKFFHLLGPILDTLQHGKVLIIDELDTKLHPLLTQRIVKLFNSKSTNPNNAQLIFATHDTNLLDAKIFRRDQIWFTEKDRYGATQLYSLTDFKKTKKPRNDEKLEKSYTAGKYGAIPFLGDFDDLFEQLTRESNE